MHDISRMKTSMSPKREIRFVCQVIAYIWRRVGKKMNVKNEKSLRAEWKTWKNLKSFETICCFLVCTLYTRCPTSNNLPNKVKVSDEACWKIPVKSVNIFGMLWNCACFLSATWKLHPSGHLWYSAIKQITRRDYIDEAMNWNALIGAQRSHLRCDRNYWTWCYGKLKVFQWKHWVKLFLQMATRCMLLAIWKSWSQWRLKISLSPKVETTTNKLRLSYLDHPKAFGATHACIIHRVSLRRKCFSWIFEDMKLIRQIEALERSKTLKIYFCWSFLLSATE